MKYCSLDLELTGFDPLKDEILEIGLAFFEPSVEGLKVTDTWSQTFRPKGEVHPKILGLTGITNEELQQAPLLADQHDEIQKKLKDCVIVGHNIVLDAKFLEAFGFHLSGQFIDTLDLVQFLLPTHHSYNLENLMHYFGIAHKEAHRAGGDSLATIKLLEQLIKKYQSFPEELKTKLSGLIVNRKFTWQELFVYSYTFPVESKPADAGASHIGKDNASADQTGLHIKPGAVTLVPFNQSSAEPIAQALQADKTKHLLVIDDKREVLQLWQQGLVHGLFSPEERFDPAKFEHFLQRPDLTDEESMFALKILVWLHTNWQTETIIDLNLSFFGGQFRSMINSRQLVPESLNALVACDYETFTLLAEQKLHIDRTPVLWNAHLLEQWLSEGAQGRLTWNKVLYLLKSIYNPETNFGQHNLRAQVTNALVATDLFFSLVSLDINKHFNGEQYVTYDRLAADDFMFSKIKSAAESFISKIELVTKQGQFPELEKVITSLGNFFTSTPDHIKWIETSETNCVFMDRPLHIASVLKKILQPFASAALIENLYDDQLLQYLIKRLDWPGQGIEKVETDNKLSAKLIYHTQPLREQDILNLLQPEHLPALVVFSTKTEVREFYDRNYASLKKLANVFAQSYSGGSNKILRNFAIRPASILLATPGFITQNKRPVIVRTAIMTALPTVPTQHPYLQALQNHWENSFPGFFQVLSWLQFNLLLQTIGGLKLEQLDLYAEPSIIPKLEQLPFSLIKLG